MHPVALHACNPGPMTGDGNWTWLLPGRVPTLVDAGTGEAGHLDAIAAALGGAALAQVVVTHAHVDHAAGAIALAARFPGARFLKMPWHERDTRWAVPWERLADGQVVEAGDTRLEVVHTPGHAPDHLCLWHPESRTMFSSDLAVKNTTVYIPIRSRGDLSEYLASVARVLALRPARLLPAHGPVIDDPESVLRGYLEHRGQREVQILNALPAGGVTLDALVPLVYRGLRPQLVGVAQETVEAHLVKLEREGRVARRGERWHKMEP